MLFANLHYIYIYKIVLNCLELASSFQEYYYYKLCILHRLLRQISEIVFIHSLSSCIILYFFRNAMTACPFMEQPVSSQSEVDSF